MIPSIRLDEDTFQDIFENARKRIPLLYPEWTNFNENDSGIAMLELFAWMKEVQEFHLNQIGLENEAVYLKLLGMKRKEIHPAKAVVSCYPVKKETQLLEGAEFQAGNIPFCAVETVSLYAGKLDRIRTGSRKRRTILTERQWAESGTAMRVPLFSEMPEEEPFLELEFDRPLTAGTVYGVYMCLKEDERVKRNPVSGEFEAFADIEVECLDGEKKNGEETWKKCELKRDDTYAFLYSGIMRIRLPETLKEGESRAIRFVFSAGEYDVAPLLSQIYLNPVELSQEQRIKHQILGEGTGFPSQRFSLGITGVIPESVQLEAENPEHPGEFEPWARVEDFAGSGPEDRHFMVDGEQGNICFGDGFHGMPPEGMIRLRRMSQTEGIHGNVKQGQIHPKQAERKEEALFAAWNFENVTGGQDRETMENAFLRFEADLAKRYTAVTEEDYETIVKRTPGLMIDRVKVVKSDWDQNRVTVAVKPWSEKKCPRLSRAYRNNIAAFMKERRLLGTDVQIAEPDYIQIRIYADLELVAWYRDTEQFLREKIEAYFRTFCSEFGSTVLYSGLYGYLDGMEGIKRIRSLTIDASGQEIRRNINGDVFLPPTGLAVLDQIQLSAAYTG